MAEIVLGRGEQWVRIRALRREFPGSKDYWDGNWLICEIEIQAGAFRGRLESLLRTDEFAQFREGLVKASSELCATAAFDSMEEWLNLEFKGDGRGHFRGACRADDQPGVGNKLEFELIFDQTDLPAYIKSLDELLQEFPVVGRP